MENTYIKHPMEYIYFLNWAKFRLLYIYAIKKQLNYLLNCPRKGLASHIYTQQNPTYSYQTISFNKLPKRVGNNCVIT